MKQTPKARRRSAFTLIELLVVITVIVILIGLLFPAFRGVQDQAKRTQAKNDVTQIVTAVNAFYTEYGQYPCTAQTGTDAADFVGSDDTTRKGVFDTLRVPTPTTPPTLNPRAIVFLQVPAVKTDVAGQRKSGVGSDGVFYDPWGLPYWIKIDNNYNGTLTNPYTANSGAGPGTINIGAIAWSVGSDGQLGTKQGTGSGDNMYKTSAGVQSDDVISWQ